MELRPKVVEADMVLAPVAMLVVVPDAVVAEPMAAVAEIQFESVEPKEVVLGVSAAVVASMAVEAESLSVMVVPMEPGVAAAALVLGVDPKVVVTAAYLAARESVSRGAEPEDETVVALEVGSMLAEFEGSNYL